MSIGDQVEQMLREKVQRIEIARRLGVTKSTVSYHAKTRGFVIRELVPHDWEAIQEFYDAGATIKQCCVKFHVSSSAIAARAETGSFKKRRREHTVEEILALKVPLWAWCRQRLLEAGVLKNECYECGLPPAWNGKPLTLHLDHFDGNKANNAESNLRMLCPNCHQQTPNWGSKNRNNPMRVRRVPIVMTPCSSN